MATLNSMATTKSTAQAQIWGALSLIDIVNSFQVHKSLEPRKYSLPPNAPRDARRLLKLVSAVALIAANQPTWQSISAAAFEQQQEGQDRKLVIRISQNEHLNHQALNSLNSILSMILTFVEGPGGKKWRCKQSFTTIPRLLDQDKERITLRCKKV
ncbi:hypothetical protein RUND412_007632 [Rhizina undulata]